MTLARRKIALEFSLAEGELDGGAKTITLTGHRTECIIAHAGVPMSHMDLRVYGVSEDFIRQFSTYKILPTQIKNDTVTVLAGDDVNGMKQVFEGTMLSAVPNYSAAPDISFDIISRSGMFYKIAPAAANTYEGSTDVATIVSSLAKKMGFAFRNNGVTAKLSNPYLDGTLMDQLFNVVEAAGIVCTVDNGIISIWPNSSGIDDNDTIVLNKDTGLVGYPTFIRQGIVAQAEFMPELKRGSYVQLESMVPNASGLWRVQSMRHELSTVDPKGKWFTTLQLTDEGFYVSTF